MPVCGWDHGSEPAVGRACPFRNGPSRSLALPGFGEPLYGFQSSHKAAFAHGRLPDRYRGARDLLFHCLAEVTSPGGKFTCRRLTNR